jgi:hypothetical protein
MWMFQAWRCVRLMKQELREWTATAMKVSDWNTANLMNIFTITTLIDPEQS